MNDLLQALDKPVIPDAEHYRARFRFPLQRFYADVGITDDEYHAAVDQYLDLLAADDSFVPLHEGAREVITGIHERGVQQVLASATESHLLDAQMRPHDLADAFATVLGITDAYHASKRDVIASWLSGTGLAATEVLLVGDTNHDQEIAADLGTRFVHFTGGHQDLSGIPGLDRIATLNRLTDHLGEC